MSTPDVQSATLFIDPAIFREIGVSINASIDSVASQAKDSLSQNVDSVIETVVSGAFSAAYCVISASVGEDLASNVIHLLEESQEKITESSQKVAREYINASIDESSDSSKASILNTTEFSAEQAEYSNNSLNSWLS